MALKPNLKCSKFAQYKAEYEEKIAIAEANIDKALADRKKVEAVHNALSAQKNELVLALQSGGSAVQDIIGKYYDKFDYCLFIFILTNFSFSF